MKEVIKILREQLILCAHMEEVIEQQKKVLLKHSAGTAASDAAKKLELLLLELGKIEARQQAFIGQSGYTSWGDFLQQQPESVERVLAVQLLQKAQ